MAKIVEGKSQCEGPWIDGFWIDGFWRDRATAAIAGRCYSWHPKGVGGIPESRRQALLAALREAREDDLRRAAAGCPDCPDSEPLVVEYLEQRGLIRLSSRRTKKNGTPSAGETASRPKRRLFGV